jgi:hypothetical protein
VLSLTVVVAGQAKTERPVPFKVGEVLTFDVSWSSYITAGTVVTSVKEKKASFGSTAYYIVAEARPTPLLSKLYSLYYKVDTLIDVYSLLPQRGSIYSEEGSRHRFKATQFNRQTNQAVYEYNAGAAVRTNVSTSPVSQDALSAIYVLRAVPFKAGERMTMPVSDSGQTYKGQFAIGGSERIKTGLGVMNASRITLNLVDEKNRAVGRNIAIWMSDDARRLPVKIQAEVAVGSFNLTLREAR